jgi:predicted transcriptional regulator of viral defense system
MSGERNKGAHTEHERSTRGLVRLAGELAGCQHGVVSAKQLKALGLSRSGVGTWVARGRLHCLYRGVYSVGHDVLTREGRFMGAVLAGGEDAVLSGWAAAALWGMYRWYGGRIEVTVARKVRNRDRLHFHRRELPPDEITELDGIPVTTVARTLFDLAATANKHQLRRAMHEADVRRLPEALGLRHLLHRYPGHRGTRTIRAALEDRTTKGVTRNDFEAAFLGFLERAGLPMPEVNAPLQLNGKWIDVDFLWREQKVIVELDGRETHHTVKAFENDRARGRALSALKWQPIRVTWLQLEREQGELERDLRRLLA